MKGRKVSDSRLTLISPSDDLADHHIPIFFNLSLVVLNKL